MGHGETSVQVRILSADMARHNHLGQSRMTFDQTYVAQENALRHAHSLVWSLSTRLVTNFLQLVVQPIHYSRPEGFLRGKCQVPVLNQRRKRPATVLARPQTRRSTGSGPSIRIYRPRLACSRTLSILITTPHTRSDT